MDSLAERTITFADLTELTPQELLPPCERADADTTHLTLHQTLWRQRGYVVLRDFIPDDLVDAYVRRRERDGEYNTPIPYMLVPELRDICCYDRLAAKLKELLGEEAGLHLNLTGWRSTERNWHQDYVLNPPHVGCFYAAVWFALDEIDSNAGPFEFIPESHLWPGMTQARTLAHLLPEERALPTWPKIAERFQVEAAKAEIRSRCRQAWRFHAGKGDILIWHSKLMHRGSTPNNPDLERRALIAHYSGVFHRQDMPIRERHNHQGIYFAL
jgi:hypothetical protein